MRPPVVVALPGSLDARTGGSIYDRRLAEGLRALGWSVGVTELDPSFPRPTAAALDETARVLAGVADGTLLIVDSLALGAMPALVERHAGRLRVVALVHLPLAATPGLDARAAAGVELAEGRALRATRLAVVTGASARPMLAPYRLAPDRVVVVEPGTDRAPLARGSTGADRRRTLLSAATVHAGKGHETLLRALARVSDRAWTLRCAGSLTRDPRTVARIRAVAADLGLSGRVTFTGELGRNALDREYDAADVFVHASCRETYGMAVGEALARGLPVVATAVGAAPELLAGGGGMLVAAGDVDALASAIARVLDDDGLRTTLAAGARRARERLPTWDDTCRRFAAALDRVAVDG